MDVLIPAVIKYNDNVNNSFDFIMLSESTFLRLCDACTISYLFVVISLSNTHYGESLRISSLPANQVGLQPANIQTSRLRLKCRVLGRCEGQENRFSISNSKEYQTSQNVRNEIDKRKKDPRQETSEATDYFQILEKPSPVKFIYDYNSSYTQGNEVLNYQVHENNLQVTTPKLTLLSKLKLRATDRRGKIISHISRQRFHESSRLDRIYSVPAASEFLISEENNITDLPLEDTPINETLHKNKLILKEFRQGLDIFERKFYMVSFKKLKNITAADETRSENSISFVQSGLFLQLLLLAMSVQSDPDTKLKIDNCIGIQTNISNAERIQLIDDVLSMLPDSTHGLIFRWSTRMLSGAKYDVSQEFKHAATALLLHIEQANGTETPHMLSAMFNRMVKEDTKGAIHNTFEPEDLSGTIRAVFLTAVYFRCRWRTAPTVLNGSRIFRDFHERPERTIRMIRVNDMMRYVNLTDYDAEALEVIYGKPGLSLLMLVPYGSSIRRLAEYVAERGLGDITSNMTTLRVAADLPLYTLRMSLLLPNKLDGLGLSDLLHRANSTYSELKMSQGMQRLMFWAEAGRTAFKDDGFEWDDPPDMKIVVDRPYLFFVRWNNMTLMNGNFVL